MYLLGLTGSVGMGKTTAADVFRLYGAAIYDADATVHQLMSSGGSATGLVKRAFPGVVKNNIIDRKALGFIVYNDKKALAELEAIMHPLVQEVQAGYLRQCSKSRK